MAGALVGAKTYDDYRSACMRWAEDLAERRGTNKFRICDVKTDEVRNFLERVALTHRPETVHQYIAGIKKLENMVNERFGRVDWRIEDFDKPRRSREDVTVQRGPAYTPEEADRLIKRMADVDKRAADALEFIRATGCRAESIFGRQVKKGQKVVVNGRVVKNTDVIRDYSKAVTADRIDLKNGTVTLYEKGGKWRTVKYDRQYQDLMEKLVQESNGGRIFKGLKQPTMYRRIKTICSKEGFEGRGLHGMRKTFAVRRHEEYTERINSLLENKDWRTLAKDFPLSNQKAEAMCERPYEETVNKVARLKLTKDLGHNRVEVTYRYVVKAL